MNGCNALDILFLRRYPVSKVVVDKFADALNSLYVIYAPLGIFTDSRQNRRIYEFSFLFCNINEFAWF